jgi:hypothetical protein
MINSKELLIKQLASLRLLYWHSCERIYENRGTTLAGEPAKTTGYPTESRIWYLLITNWIRYNLI